MKYNSPLSNFILAILSIAMFSLNFNKADAQTLRVDTDQLDSLVLSWDDAHNRKDGTALVRMYNATVLYYGSQKDKIACIKSKQMMFKKYPEYNQEISGTVRQEQISNTEVKCSFVKRVTFNHQTKDYPSYLIFSSKPKCWIITTESDAITDANLLKAGTANIPKEAMKGDFDGNGTKEYAWLVPPEYNIDSFECSGDCTSYIRFSDSTIPAIKIEQCIGGFPSNLGDLNGNGTTEIGLSPEWFTSCWAAYYVYTLKNKRWAYAVDPFSTHCQQWEDGVTPIEIDKRRKGNVIIRYSKITDGEIATKVKSVPVR